MAWTQRYPVAVAGGVFDFYLEPSGTAIKRTGAEIELNGEKTVNNLDKGTSHVVYECTSGLGVVEPEHEVGLSIDWNATLFELSLVGDGR